MASALSKLRKRLGLSGKTRAPSLPGELCRRFSIAEIKKATHNFNKELIIYEDGFCTAYKGFINEEGHPRPVAIKVPKGADQEYSTEIFLLCQISHVHLLQFIGYCSDEGERILPVYEFMANKSLCHHLYATDKAPCLPWKRRLQICIGAARGLHYLHTGLRYPVIHRNVNTSNILLDEKWVAKFADFGLSEQVDIKPGSLAVEGVKGTLDVGFTEQIPRNATTIDNVLSGERVPLHLDLTTDSTRIAGIKGCMAPGYMAPEIFYDISLPPITEKSDVYSFGVVLFDVLCGQKVWDSNFQEYLPLQLVPGAHGCNKDGSIGKIIDPCLKGKIAPESYKVYLEVATTCLQFMPIQRPTMVDVMEKLELALELQEKADAEGETMITPKEKIT